jgi:hypothetical protein
LIEPTQLFTVRYHHHQGVKAPPVPMPPRELPALRPVPPKVPAPPFQNHMFEGKAVEPNAVVPNGEAKPVVGKNPPVVGKNPPVVGNRATLRLKFMANGLVGNRTARWKGERDERPITCWLVSDERAVRCEGVMNDELRRVENPIVLKLFMNGEAPKPGCIMLFIIMGLPPPLCIIIALPPPPIIMRWAWAVPLDIASAATVTRDNNANRIMNLREMRKRRNGTGEGPPKNELRTVSNLIIQSRPVILSQFRRDTRGGEIPTKAS